MNSVQQAPSFTNVLQISQRGKGIPYGGDGVLREDGGANYGFKNLKGYPERISSIPELADDEALRDCVASINDHSSAFGTVGCLAAAVRESQGHRMTGYVEFAFDSAEKSADAANYFPLFFHFNGALHRVAFCDKVHFHWELMGATFLAPNTLGFTIAVTINTDWYETPQGAEIAWANAVDLVAGFLRQVPAEGGSPIFVDV